MKLMNAIAISPVIIKVIPNPFNGAGMCAYLTRSLIAANPIIASNQPIPLPKETHRNTPATDLPESADRLPGRRTRIFS